MASASPARECGNYGWIEDDAVTGSTCGEIDGAEIFNVATRKEYADVRCTRRGGNVIRWQTGA